VSAPYLRIVEDVRRRIRAGELRPGDPVPSARQLMREWDIANATAAKVLSTLRQEGLVRPVRGVGTVVAGDPPPAAPTVAQVVAQAVARKRERREPPVSDLSRERIVSAAVELADHEGLGALSMRRVAVELGVATMALYRHVAGKDDLVLLMIERVIGEERFPDPGPDGWRARLELVARMQWAGFQRHRWLGPVMSITRPQISGNALAHMEWVVGALDGLGLTPSEVLHLHVTLFNFGRGLAGSIDAEVEAEQETGLTSDEWIDGQADELARLAGTGRFQRFMAALDDLNFEFDLDSLFEFGLARLLDGFAAFIEQRAAARAGDVGGGG
jgi:DNA-binding transcriptional regulator YhcF (GntR family)